MAESLDSLRGGLESHEGDLAQLCEDVGGRAEQARKEMLGFKDKVRYSSDGPVRSTYELCRVDSSNRRGLENHYYNNELGWSGQPNSRSLRPVELRKASA